MADYITVDGGTSNTRLMLVRDGEVVDFIKYPIGVRACAGGNEQYKSIIKEGIDSLISRNVCTPVRILASGMITSEYGLVKLDHITAPAGLTELNANLVEKKFSEISDIPFVFVRGIKMQGESLDSTDIMRGEETEIFGISDSDGVFALTGSHSKIITVKDGKITEFKTMLTGEMLEALATGTILSTTLDLKSDICLEYLFKGYEYCKTQGINEALFKVRVLDTVFGKNKSEIYSFFAGAVLCGEIEYILSLSSDKIVVCGNKYIKEAEYELLKHLSKTHIEIISDDVVSKSVAFGVIKIYENK